MPGGERAGQHNERAGQHNERAGQFNERAGQHNELSGTVMGPAVQAGAIHGGVHFHHDPRAEVPIPRQLLPPSPHFTSRGRELAALDEALDRGGAPLVILSGPGGVGKTALAMRWADRVRDRFPDGQLYVDLGGFGGDRPVDPGEALGGFLRALGLARERIPMALAEQAALFRSMVAGRTLLVVLDNAYSAAQARVLLPAAPAGMVLITSRSRLVGLVPDGARLIEVAPLPAGDALALLERAVGGDRIARERDRAEDLAGMCAGLPIALSVAAARLAARPRMSVDRMAAELADEAGRLGALSTADGSGVQAAFDVSYRFLEPSAADLYRALSLHPGPEFGGAGPVAAVGPLIAARSGSSARMLDQLVEASLLDEVGDDRFRFHDLLRLHARQKAEAEYDPAVRELTRLTILEWYLAAAGRADAVLTPYRRRLPYAWTTEPVAQPAVAGREAALGWLEGERVNLIAAGRAALEHGYAELAWHLAYVLWPLFLYRKHYRDRLEVDQWGVEAAHRWGNPWAAAVMHKRLGRISAIAGDQEAAERHTRAAIELYAEARDVEGGLDAREGLAALYRDTGRGTAAADMFADVLAANRRLGEPRRIGLSLINLGLLLPRLGRVDEAIVLLTEAAELFARLSDVDPYNQARVSIALAAAQLGARDLDRAERSAAEAADRMRALGSEHEWAEAIDLLGQVEQRRGDAEAAGRHYRSALRIFDALGSARAPGVRGRLAGLRLPAAGLRPPATAADGESG